MAEPRTTIWCALLLLAALACSGSPEPQMPAAGPQATPATPTPPPPPEPTPVEETVVVIDPGEGEEALEPTLVEASQAERERRQQTDQPRIVITNENLADYSRQGQLTYVVEEAAASAVGEGPQGEERSDLGEDEIYWRNRVLDLRLAIRAAVDEIEALERRAGELRTRFYAEDDPYVRDGRVKPAWDRTLDLLAEAKEEEKRLRQELQQTLEEGRQAGALPGWLREGVEIEPPPLPPEPPGYEAREPTEAPAPVEPNSETDGR